MNKKANILPFAAFLIILVLPMIMINRINGVVLQNEKRQATAFPALFDQQGKLNEGLKENFTVWISDNIGFRSRFVKLYSLIKIRIFRISTNQLVHFGKDDWYFYTGDRNLEIGLGAYQLSEETLQKSAEVQQTISDYYKTKGITYVLMENPSKASVYTEYTGKKNAHTGDTVVDIMEKYLKEHTTVSVVNTKHALLTEKTKSPSRLLYLKTDTHWNSLGAYIGYRAALDEFNRIGVTKNEKSMEVTIGEAKDRTGEFGAMLGDRDILGKETVPEIVQFNANFTTYNVYNPNDYFNQVVSLSWNPQHQTYCAVFENPNAKQGTLLIYGDSMMIARSVFFVEHFRRVVLAGMSSRPCNTALEDFVKPDVVLFSSVERYLPSRLSNQAVLSALPAPPALPLLEDDVLGGIPLRSRVRTGYGFKDSGMWLDYSNNKLVVIPQEVRLQADVDCNLRGWALDVDALGPLKSFFVKVGDTLFECNYGSERTSVSNTFKNQNLLNTGFTVTIPRQYLDGVAEISFIMMGGGEGTDGLYQYEPITYPVILED
jgi:hypothetical protein